MALDPDQELVERARQSPEGDLRAFEQLVERYQEKIVTNCRYLSRSPQDAEDLAQEVFLKVYFGLQRFEGRSAFRTWVQRIKVNHCLNHLKKAEGKTFVDIDDLGQHEGEVLSVKPDVGRRAQAREQGRKISEALDSMPDSLRIPLILRDMDELAYQDIADVLGIGLSAVKMRIKRGRERFQQQYGRARSARPRPGPETSI